MDERDHKRNTDMRQDPWDSGFYETGSTEPPKCHRSVYALVLVGGILLGGIFTAIGGANSVLVQRLRQPEDRDTLQVSLYAGETGNTETEATVPSGPVSSTGNMSVELTPAPGVVDTPTQQGGLSLQSIYEKCIHSVVSITCTLQNGTASGTGVVLSENGYLITNCHVVEGADGISVLLTDGRTFDARLVGTDSLSDLAVLYIEAEDLTPAEFGDSGTLRVGDTVVAIGDPLGVELRGTMTDGIVSAINRDITTGGRTMTLIQTNAALNSGNSGGPLINCYGQVVGINVMKIGDYVNSSGVEGLGFAIPSTTVKEVVDQLISQGYVSGRPSLGITGTSVPEFYQYYYRLPGGVYVSSVEPGSDAENQGIHIKDILLSVDGKRVYSEDEIRTILYAHQVGETVEVIIYRSGQQYKVNITLIESRS